MPSLNEMSFEEFAEIIELSTDEMCGFIRKELHAASKLSEQERKDATEESIKIIIETIYLADSRRTDVLSKIFDRDKAEFLTNHIARRKLDIAKALVKQHNATIKPTMTDFNWKSKWILGNSSSTVMKYPIVNLELFTCSHEDDAHNVSLELTKTELEHFINLLEEQYNKL